MLNSFSLISPNDVYPSNRAWNSWKKDKQVPLIYFNTCDYRRRDAYRVNKVNWAHSYFQIKNTLNSFWIITNKVFFPENEIYHIWVSHFYEPPQNITWSLLKLLFLLRLQFCWAITTYLNAHHATFSIRFTRWKKLIDSEISTSHTPISPSPTFT